MNLSTKIIVAVVREIKEMRKKKRIYAGAIEDYRNGCIGAVGCRGY